MALDYKQHTSKYLQSSGKAEKMNHILKENFSKAVKKLMNPEPTCFLLHYSGSV